MTEPIRWGILSTANIGRARVIPAIQKSNTGTVVAVASRDQRRAQDFASELNIPTAYGSYEALLAAPDIDAIYNPLPNSLHAEWAIKCAEAGKPMLCEKPLASDVTEAQQIVDAFVERGILFAEAFMYRFHPQTERVRAMLDEGAVGEMHVVQATFTFAVRSESNIRLSQELAGGSLMDVGCYCVNVMRLMVREEPDDVHAIARFGDVDEKLTGILSFPSGVIGHFDSSLRTYRTHTYEIRGSRGRIRVPEAFVPDHTTSPLIQYWNQDGYEEIHIEAADQYQLMVEDFQEAYQNKHPPRFHPQDAVDNMMVIDKLLESARR